MNVPVLAALLGCASIMLCVYGVSSSLNSRQARQSWRKRAEGAGEKTPPAATQEGPSYQAKPMAKFLGTLGGATKPKDEEEFSHVRKTLTKAGYRHNEAPIILYGVKLCGAILLPILFALVRIFVLTTLPSVQTMGLFVLSALVGFYLPDLLVQLKIKRRKQKILNGFPDALDLMVVCVEAGLGLDAAIVRVGEELRLNNNVLSEEFQLLNLGLRAGQSRQNALRNLANRTDLEDVNNLVTLLIQTDRFGTGIAQTLRVYSDSMRTKRHQRAEELAAKLPVKLLFPLIFFIFPSLFVVILGPAVIKIFRVLLPTLSGG